MSSEDTSHSKHPLVVPFQDADRIRRLRKAAARSTSSSHASSLACDQDFLDVLSAPLREDRAENRVISDEEWRHRNVDNILALLKANAELRALAVKLSDILAARCGWDGNSLAKITKATRRPARNPRQG
ncbi:MAG TPA: hypothetical protein VKY22_30170 [Bradyrhizobium sp.]|nr:hypothetical protein [Bradyrhizobium sp.]